MMSTSSFAASFVTFNYITEASDKTVVKYRFSYVHTVYIYLNYLIASGENAFPNGRRDIGTTRNVYTYKRQIKCNGRNDSDLELVFNNLYNNIRKPLYKCYKSVTEEKCSKRLKKRRKFFSINKCRGQLTSVQHFRNNKRLSSDFSLSRKTHFRCARRQKRGENTKERNGLYC